jgi:hypothetical protein
MSLSQIAQRLHLSRNTARAIIGQQGEMPLAVRRDKIQVDRELLERLLAECDGWKQRVYEKLVEEHGIVIAYSTLTRLLRELQLEGHRKSKHAVRCARVPDQPGGEMQHDTSSYVLPVGGQSLRVVASLIYLRYSKRRYLRFYRRFNRFRMQCFFHQALMHWQHAALLCIIDNTSLARLRGTGSHAVIVPAMEAFAKQYGFQFVCHEKGHCNRKAGEERSFWTVETNFFPGRHFASLEDLNQQALEWATVRMEHRPQGPGQIIPAEAFATEQPDLVSLPAHLPAPHQVHPCGIDQYGYVAFNSNYYWVPGKAEGGSERGQVQVFEYSDSLQIYLNRKCVVEYRLPPEGTHNQLFSPEGMPKPRHQPHDRRHPTTEEEKQLRTLSPTLDRYLDFVLPQVGDVRRHRWIRELFALSRRMPQALFLAAVERALHYEICDLETVRRIARLTIRQPGQRDLFDVEVDENVTEREAYQQGRITEAPDFSWYDDWLQESEPETEDRDDEDDQNRDG